VETRRARRVRHPAAVHPDRHQPADAAIDELPLDAPGQVIDGAAGLHEDNTNLPDMDPAWWRAYVAKLEQVAKAAGER
jgi:hypothetical protein